MAQLSRPYQLGLLGIVLLAAVWLALFQGHSSSSTGGAGSSAPAVQTVTTTTAVAGKHGAGATTKIYKGSAPGVEGLTKAIAKAQGAVNTSQQNAKALEEKSAAASDERAASSSSSSSSAGTHAAAAPAKAVAKSPTTAAKSTPSSAAKTTPAKPATTGVSVPANQKRVEAELNSGKIAVILFWDPRGADDSAVHRAVQSLNHSKLGIAISYAGSNQVATFGTITRGVQVDGTPTLLVVNKKGQTFTLTGLQDDFAIEQAISEARKA
jgi:hypothetical protein